MERIKGEDLKLLTRGDLYRLFVEAVMDSSDEQLDQAMQSEVLDEDDESVIGKFKLIHTCTNKGYITFVVTFVDEETMTVFNIEKNIIVAEFHRNREYGSWSDLKAVEVGGEQVVSMSDVLEKVISRLRKRLK